MSISSILRRGPFRFAVLIAFIILVAALARLADLAAGWILAVIAIAWVLAALIERSAHRAASALAQHAAATPAPAPVETAPAVPEPVAPPPVARVPVARPGPAVPDEAELWLDGDAEIDPGPAPVVPWSQPVPAAPPLVAREPLRPAAPEPEPELLLPPVPRVAASSSLRRVSLNLWELERVARAAAGTDLVWDEERSLILMYLREFASADGVLGPEFDNLVRESFGDLLPQR